MNLYGTQLIDNAYNNLKISSSGAFINATVLVGIFYNHVNNKELLVWYFLISSVSLLRFFSYKLYKKNNHKFSIQRWKQIFYGGLIVSSILFGLTPFLFFVQQSPLHQAALIIIISGLSAGGVSSLSSLIRAVQLFLVFILTPLIIKLLMQNTLLYNSIAFLVFLYLILMLYIAKEFYKNYLNILISKQMYKKTAAELSISENRFKTVFKQAPLGIFMYDTNMIIHEVNQEFMNFLEASQEFLISLDLHTLPDQRIFPSLQAPLDNIEGFYEGQYTTKFKQKNLWISMNTSPLKDINNNVIGGIGIVTDITHRIQTQLQFEHQAKHDTLTDIANRSLLLEKIEQEIIRYKRHNIIFGVIFLDLDHFKNINDSLGHAVGDELLIQTAHRLKDVIRVEDTIARIGGDEFVILLPDLANEMQFAATNAERIAEKIHNILSKSFKINDLTLNVSASLGIAFIGNGSQSPDDILKYADIAMYEAKKAGRNTTKFYQHKMDEWISRRMAIENGLRDAVKNQELELHYQPIIDFATSKVIGAEALLRWNTPKFNDVYPDEFIPIAEESGLILEIGKWVLQTALKQFVAWQKEFTGVIELQKIAVNISAHQFENSNFLHDVDSIIKKTNIKPSCLELELVESALVENLKTVSTRMQKLRDLGVSISIDDFGTGYSSLSYLKKLPFTTLKIDKSFVMDIQNDVDDKELISAILMIAQTFNFEVVAEGVETQEQYLFLKEKKCTYLQGYYCSKPLPNEQFIQFLRKNSVRYSF
ncbi:sensor domain-containing protein [Sulfurimonas autotrophica]|uniref:Diguanylate cyclase/phosphodiesterase with PAS/PAC sensor(S) n=1 Tax=Sulfurimonas autotrophica (strain ATCC BAA-671 / DSM 16294 / JCM 11897 / OK10) TaxID=563040 RepID=E0URY5_SULAO|nr:bifunctional diguanylate cyclase/phosphodiesterase [Sulfurimonas autotrophica]ADN09008.1 diguanylate cyclase/phosphodiesterase with PAS/PAC sensor(s) [Sulfurimonas autotrophica DSM 16294]